jgi:serine protease Do
VGQAVPITIWRGGQERPLRVTPIAWPVMETASATGEAGPAHKPIMLVPPNLGLSLSTMTADLRARNGLSMHQTGVLVDGVAAGTDAFDRGITRGDVILRIQDKDVTTPQEVQAAVDAARAQHKAFVVALMLPKVEQTPGPRWIALRVVDEATP